LHAFLFRGDHPRPLPPPPPRVSPTPSPKVRSPFSTPSQVPSLLFFFQQPPWAKRLSLLLHTNCVKSPLGWTGPFLTFLLPSFLRLFFFCRSSLSVPLAIRVNPLHLNQFLFCAVPRTFKFYPPPPCFHTVPREEV